MTQPPAEAIQPTMRRLVAWLNKHNFPTVDSGDGVTNVEAGMECALDFSNVFIQVKDAERLIIETHRLMTLLKLEGVVLDDKDGPSVEASYRPTDQVPIIALYGLTDADLPEGFGSKTQA